ncbi:DUF3443 family protein [Caballeronia arationis]|uniref:DUF3443 family protein n=1 Tax=Caballeronia arationis TaxID=1777142 RepID=UPI000786B2E8|nr:DUF3443 family protein [Caballeronia arationis]
MTVLDATLRQVNGADAVADRAHAWQQRQRRWLEGWRTEGQARAGPLTFSSGTRANNSTSCVSMAPGLSNGITTTYNGQSMTAILGSGSSVDYIASAPLWTCTVQGLQWYCARRPTSQVGVVYRWWQGAKPDV